VADSEEPLQILKSVDISNFDFGGKQLKTVS
jgi:hypothetical protein